MPDGKLTKSFTVSLNAEYEALQFLKDEHEMRYRSINGKILCHAVRNRYSIALPAIVYRSHVENATTGHFVVAVKVRRYLNETEDLNLKREACRSIQ